MKFERSAELLGKMTIDALDRDVKLDEDLECIRDGNKLRVYSTKLRTFIQFPTALRRYGKRYVADIIKCGGAGRKTFYRAYRSTIRDVNGNVIG